ncbi:stage II sporulation protein M [Breznakiella homolactica]|uniref:Stage II sporulation protein M n=1 Tax=Breznakiella homolactica TaxID=2798577 RepID=A0A7T7XQ87_9SPIR|nr:stage II sporulation protein M [Breznakiella homolactica]QQO10482.1 stage II sporulation protein M [Breznakiella homolactica]
MTQERFLERRQASWDKIEGIVNGSAKNIRNNAAWFPRAFRELTQDLNTARAHAFDPVIIERLNRLVLEGNQLLYGQHSWSVKGLVDFILRTFPQSIRTHWKGIAAVHLIFYGIMLFTGFLCVRFPEMVYEIMGERQAWNMEQMYDPESDHFLEPRDVSGDADMFGFYIYNNISIAFRSFAGGIIAGVGSLIILAFNAVFLGAAAGHIINSGFAETFFGFIIGHSSFELTAIVLSAFGGLQLGYRLFITQGLTRAASMRRAGKTVIPIISGSAIMLVIAAVIEAFWSSQHQFPMALRLGAGIAGWVLLFLYFILAGRGKSHD